MPQKRKPSRTCSHNEFDTVRAHKGKATLRCRVCQKQSRVLHITSSDLRCKDFNTPAGCQVPNCKKFHIHYKKQTLETRCSIHGKEIMKSVRGVSESRMMVLNMIPSPTSSPSSCPSPIPSLCSLDDEDFDMDLEMRTDTNSTSSSLDGSGYSQGVPKTNLSPILWSNPAPVATSAPVYCVMYVGSPYMIPAVRQQTVAPVSVLFPPVGSL
eukprot:TRINITY_DN7912_c0_g1_i1.p1 TRINITY_DN7912_c0_g1~~TRINITY_DN7912_c0_g1_i1.p1  ORF type:complete len:222 (+),score=37.76 TRINITY_DN7912_c0_g1_i1:35-667(+)